MRRGLWFSSLFVRRNIGHAKPGCILLDVQMPALDGLQLQEELSKLPHSWPIIFMTGHGDIPTSVRAIKAGVEDFLSKPVSRQTLLETIERAFARYSAQRESRDQLDSFKFIDRDTDASRKRGVFADGPRQDATFCRQMAIT